MRITLTLPPRPLAFLLATLLAVSGCAGPDFPGEASSRFAAAEPVRKASPPPRPEPGVPQRIPLTVQETAGVARSGEIVESGVALARALAVVDPARLAVVDAAGQPVPAEVRVLARWNAGRDGSNAPIQWLMVAFPATVRAKGATAYTLVTDGSVRNPAPPVPLKVRQDGDRVTVETGAAVFRLGGDPAALFDEVRTGSGPPLVTGSEMTLRINAGGGTTGRHALRRRLRIEHAGPLTAAVVVEGAYDLPAVGEGGFGTRRRYVFHAGSPTVRVRQAVAWEGTLGCQGCLQTKDGRPNGVLVEQARDALRLGFDTPATVTAVGDFEAPALESGPPAETAEAVVRQIQRPRRLAPFQFEARIGDHRATGDRADGGLLAASGPGGTVAVALDHMHRYEPQALRLLPGGRLAVDFVDDHVWLAHHQGLFATLAVSALPGAATRSDLDRLVWAPLNRPLRAWPDAAGWAASQAVPEIPAGKLPKNLAAYDKLILAILEKTVRQSDAEGFAGLMTFGLYPRYWGKDNFSEIQCKGGDPTPGQDWDEAFWCGSWTDYHSTLSTAVYWAMRSGDVEWLDEIAFPGALRMLHTQIMQCGPDEKWFYCGQSPAGYAAYRSDFNSSHAYFENLFLYYWLTGDSTVLDLLQRGGDSMRRRACNLRGPGPVTAPIRPEGPACPPGHPPSGEGFTGRVAAEWTAAYRFLGLASDDPSFLEDYRSNLARALTQSYAEVEKDGRRYGFLGERIETPGTGQAGPFWTNGFYDAENLYRFQVDTGDEPIGAPPLAPSRVLAAMARTVVGLEPQAYGGKSVQDRWPRFLTYTWTGPRIGGRLTGVQAKDRELYGPEKAGNTALLVRAGQQTGDPDLLKAGEQLVEIVLDSSKGERVPLGKLQGQYLTRLHAAVGRLAAGGAPKVPAGR